MLLVKNKRLLLVLALALMVTILPVSAPVYAYAEYTASHVPLVSTESVESLGSLIVTFNSLPACSEPPGFNQDHQFIVKLPPGFEITRINVHLSTPTDSAEVLVTQNSENQFVVEIYNAEWADEVKCAVSIETYVPHNAPESINVSIMSQPGSYFTDAVVQAARTAFGIVSVKVDEPFDLTSAGGSVELYFYESQANALREGANCLTLKLPQGFTWAEPASGDFITMDNSYLGRNDFNIEKTNASTLRFDRYGSADKAYVWKLTAAIKVNETAVTEGDIKLNLDGTSSIQPKTIVVGNYTKDEQIVAPPAEPNEPGRFIIGAKTYYVGSQAYFMDTASYIKNNRTYVPMRYLGDILGAEVVWDAAARTITLTKGATTVVFTVGSTTYTVNGKSKTMEVSPEIMGDRTMLPARFVAEAFAALVTWDASTQTVLIQR